MSVKHWLLWPAVLGLGAGCGGTVVEEPREEAQASQALATCESVSLFKDIHPSGHGSPEYLTLGDGMFFFLAKDNVSGTELWKSDGTVAGTVMVKDINPGAGNSLELRPGYLVFRNGTLFFTATNGSAGVELWKSNGTAAGTVMVKDINPGSASSSPQHLTFVGNTLYFSADNGSSGRELWKSDGTAAGTVLVKDIFKKSTSGSSSTPEGLREFNGMLYFSANDSTGGTELWKSDGTAAGTVMVKDLDPGPPGSAPRQLKVMGGQLFFLAYNGNYGHELWKSDGTAGGTVLVKDIFPGSTSGVTTWLWDVGTALYFGANDGVHGAELWKSDGTAAGTVMVKDLTPGPTGSALSAIPYGNWDGTLLFSGPPNNLWKSDGTEAGTVFLADPLEDRTLLCPWVCPPDFGYLRGLNGAYYFFTDDGLHGNELWKTDGTPAGTALLRDISPGSSSSVNLTPTWVTFNGSIFVTAAGPEGIELWTITPQTCP